MKYVGVIILALALGACAKGDKGNSGDNGVTGPAGPQGPAAPSPTPTAIQQVISEWAVNNPTVDPLQRGLICTLYKVPNIPASPCLTTATGPAGCSAISSSTGYASAAPAYVYGGTIDQPNQAGTSGFNMFPSPQLGSVYPTNFALTCTGYLVTVGDESHEFALSADDGALLYIDGSLVINNDGEHAIQTVTGLVNLTQTVHSFKIEYFQGPGNVGLVLDMDGSLLSAGNLYH